jgi:hypothetical protein
VAQRARTSSDRSRARRSAGTSPTRHGGRACCSRPAAPRPARTAGIRPVDRHAPCRNRPTRQTPPSNLPATRPGPGHGSATRRGGRSRSDEGCLRPNGRCRRGSTWSPTSPPRSPSGLHTSSPRRPRLGASRGLFRERLRRGHSRRRVQRRTASRRGRARRGSRRPPRRYSPCRSHRHAACRRSATFRNRAPIR